ASQGRAVGCCPGLASVPPGIGNNVADGWGFRHNGHLSDDVTAERRLRSRFQALKHEGKSLYGMFLRPFPCRKAVKLHSLAPPSKFVRQELSLGRYQYAIWRDSWSST